MEFNSPYRPGVTAFLAFAFILGVISAGCSKRTSFGGDVQGTVESIDAAFERSSLGKTVVMQGRIHDICRDEGCWFILSDSSREITVRYVDETGLGIPVISGGSKARVKGRIRDTVIGRNRVPELRATGVVLLTE